MHVQVKFADLKFTVIARYKQTRKHTHVLRNEVMLVCGSLRLAPISYAVCAGVMYFHYSCHGWFGQNSNLEIKGYIEHMPLVKTLAPMSVTACDKVIPCTLYTVVANS